VNFDTAIQGVLKIEGGYSDHPSDRGGKTNWGITERTARANGYAGDMRTMPRAAAIVIYKAQYWDILNLDAVALLSYPIAREMFDTEVNGGDPGESLQRALNAFNRDGKDYPDVIVDGRIGPMTISALQAFLARRGKLGERNILKALNCIQGARFLAIAERDHSQEAFVTGWFSHRVEI